MAAFNFIHFYDKHCESRRERGLLRDLNRISPSLQQPGVIDFSSNDYLGLSRDKRLLSAAQRAGEQWGVGATGSRLLSGDSSLFQVFENRIAQDKGTESALIFNSGFQANSAVLAALCDERILGAKAIVFFDKYNHASLYQGCFTAQVDLQRYRHNDIKHLEKLLQKYDANPQPKIIVSETIFGMDGDSADVESLIDLSEKYNALLYLDEAHATGLWGERGYGISTLHDFKNVPHVIMGTFSKALGCAGGYVACSHVIKQYLINQCAGFIYSTAPSPLVIGAAYEAWKCVETLDEVRGKIFSNAEYMRAQLKSMKYSVGNSSSNIIPIILGEEELVLKRKNDLEKCGILVSAIRPPTVPPKTARLRIAINASHTKEAIDDFLSQVKLWQ